MDKDITGTTGAIIQTTCGFAALLDLLMDKGVITEDEYNKKYEEIKKYFMDSAVEEMKKKFL